MKTTTQNLFEHRVDQLASERGASSVEYALLGALIAAVIVVLVTLLGLGVLQLFESLQ